MNSNLEKLNIWTKSIFEDFKIDNPTSLNYLSLLLTIRNYDSELSFDSFIETQNEIEDFFINMEDPTQEDVTQISIFYEGEISNIEDSPLINDLGHYLNENIKNLNLKDNLLLTIFSNKSIGDEKKRKISENLKSNVFKFSEVESLTFNNMEQRYQNQKRRLNFVPEFIFQLDNNTNFLNFEMEGNQSVVVNVAASSIKKVYKDFGQNCGPLYGNNLRYHVVNKRIDNDIRKSIENNPGDFWFKNNGIVIICEDMEFTNKGLIVKDFSFVNGGQTSYMLGESSFTTDFFVLVKVISTKDMNKNRRDDFILNVATATNKQKPIKDSDLEANQTNLKNLKSALTNLTPSINLQLKRGEKPLAELKNKNEKWRQVSTSDIGQIGLGFILLSPGSAKNKKSAVWAPENSDIIFDEKYAGVYMELRKLWWFTDESRKIHLSDLKKNDKLNPNVPYFSTGQWMIFVSIIFCQLIRKNENFKNLVRSTEDFKKWQKKIKDFLIEECEDPDFIKLEDIKSIMANCDHLIPEIISDFISTSYENSEYSTTGIFSNYSKADSSFYEIVKVIIKKYDKNSKFSNDIEGCLDGIFK